MLDYFMFTWKHKCRNCGDEFETSTRTRHYCTDACFREKRQATARKVNNLKYRTDLEYRLKITERAAQKIKEKRAAGWRPRTASFAHIQKREKELGLEPGTSQAMIVAQGGVCKICGRENIRGGKPWRLVLDHCHKTNKVRGMLCDGCNTSLGKFEDNVEWLGRAILYLKGELT